MRIIAAICALSVAPLVVLGLAAAESTQPEKDGVTREIHVAAKAGDMETVKRILAADPSLCIRKDKAWETPLEIAAAAGHVDLTLYLLPEAARFSSEPAGEPRDISDLPATQEGQNVAGEAIAAAARANQRGVVDALQGVGFGVADALRRLVQRHDAEAVRHLLEWAGTEALSDPADLLNSPATLPVVQVLVEHLRVMLGTASTIPKVLRRAAGSGHTDVVEWLLATGAPVEAGARRSSALHSAAITGNDRVVRLLLDHGADLDARDEQGRTPLYIAIDYGKAKQVAGQLLKAGADPTIAAANLLTPLDAAAMLGDTELALLLARDARLSDSPDTQFLLAAAHAVAALRADDTATARDIISSDLRLLGFGECRGRTALHLAASAGRHVFAAWLIAAGADVEARDNSGATSLHLALNALGWSRSGREQPFTGSESELRRCRPFPKPPPPGPETEQAFLSTIELLLKNGADPNAATDKGSTALSAAVSAGSTDAIGLMLGNGARVDGQYGEQALLAAIATPRPGVLQMLVDHGVDISAVLTNSEASSVYAVWAAGAAVAEEWLNAGLSPEAGPEDIETGLQVAASSGDIELARVLLRHGADPNAWHQAGRIGGLSPPLHLATLSGNTDLVSLLLQHGADPRARDTRGRDALCYSAYADGETTRLILAALADGAADGEAALRELALNREFRDAVARGRRDVITTCLEQRPELVTALLPGERIYTPEAPAIQVAVEQDNPGVIELLASLGARPDTPLPVHGTPLLLAASTGQTGCVRALLAAGASVSAEGRSGKTSLHIAAGKGSAATVRQLLTAGADIEARDDDGRTALHDAASSGAVGPLCLLVDAGADVDARTNNGATPLHLLSPRGATLSAMIQFPTVEHVRAGMDRIIRGRAEVDALDRSGRTPLHEAAASHNRATIEALLAHGANVNARDMAGLTAVHRVAGRKGASSWRTTRALEPLLRDGANIDARDDEGRTPLFTMVQTAVAPVSELEALLVLGADARIPDSAGTTPLALAADRGVQGYVDVLIDHGAARSPTEAATMKAIAALKNDPTAHDGTYSSVQQVAPLRRRIERLPMIASHRDLEGRTALHTAVRLGRPDYVAQLLAAGTDPTSPDAVGWTPAHYAVARTLSPFALAEALTMLRDAGADLGALDGAGNSLLHVAADKGWPAAVSVVLHIGLDPNAVNSEQLTPLHLAARECHRTAAEALLSSGAHVDARDLTDRTPLHLAADRGQTPVAELLLAHGAQANVCDRNGVQPIHLAATSWYEPSQSIAVGIIQTLLDASADINATDDRGDTPLHYAARAEAVRSAVDLLRLGTDVNPRNHARQTPLHIAAERGCAAMVRRLIEAGASLHARDADGRTPLHCAAVADYPDAVKVIIRKARSDDLPRLLRARDKAGRTPLDCARQAGHSAAARALEAAGRLQAAR